MLEGKNLFDDITSVMRLAFDSAVSEIVLVRDPILREAVPGYSSSRIISQHQIRNFLETLDGALSLCTSGRSLELTLSSKNSVMITPVLDPDRNIVGFAVVADGAQDHYCVDQFRLFESCARCVATDYELYGLATRDHLTGALSRRGFESVTLDTLGRFHRYERPASMILIDLDNFKMINDTYGHAFGDQLLQKVTSVCCKLKRAQDAFGRLGGEEFALLLPETSLQQATLVAERLRNALASLNVFSQDGHRITASFGVSTLDASITEPADWLSMCDRALYRAKNAGRNRVEVAG